MKTNEIRTLLESLGYAFVVKEDDWVRCAISRHGEQWLGKGLDEYTAIQDACNQMFPSQASRQLLERAIAEPEPEPDAAAEPEVETVVLPEKPEAPQENLAELLGQGNQTSPPEVAEPVVESVASPTSFVVPDEEEEEPQMTREEALEIVQGIEHEMDDNREDVAQMASQHQRAYISCWIFRARAVEEKFPKDERVKEAVHKVARRLTHWCKLLWPGSIRALQVYTQPSQALEGLIRYTKRPKSWADAAIQMETYLEEDLRKTGEDEYGWHDVPCLRPEPPKPARLLKEITTKIEAVIGPLGAPLDEKRKQVPREAVVAEVEELVLAAHLLRWARKSVDPLQWGMAMGALRWASRQERGQALDPLKKVLRDDYKPSQSWAALLGRDPEINRKNVLRKKVMSSLPAPDWLEEDLMAWLQNAFQVFTNPQIAKLSENVRGQIMELTNADFADADRSARSRLRKLQSIFRTNGDISDVELPSEEELEVKDTDEDEEDDKPEKIKDPNQEILEKVQGITEGKTILFVTNRPEERLHKDLQRDLKAKVHYKVGDTARTIKPIVKSVDKDRYDMVLMATGFNNHNADVVLCRAAKAEGIPYVRVQKGRRASTIRAIGRAFNLSPQGKEDDTSRASHTE